MNCFPSLTQKAVWVRATKPRKKTLLMNDRIRRRYDPATRVQTFGEENTDELPGESKAKTKFANLDGLI